MIDDQLMFDWTCVLPSEATEYTNVYKWQFFAVSFEAGLLNSHDRGFEYRQDSLSDNFAKPRKVISFLTHPIL